MEFDVDHFHSFLDLKEEASDIVAWGFQFFWRSRKLLGLVNVTQRANGVEMQDIIFEEFKVD